MSKKGIIVNKLTEMTFQELVYRMFGIINIRTKGIQTFPPVFHTVFIFLLTLVILFFFLLPAPRRYFSKACTFLCKHTPGKAKTAISLPVLLILQYAEYSIVYISLFVIRELLTWAVRGKKVASADSVQSIFNKTEQPQLSSNPCASEAQTPKSVTHFELNRLVLPIIFTPGQDILEGPLWEYD